ncbi:uncharacterized protein LOC115568489 isoform X1 [Sparus aurata]|uniref:uncharacterized protein LOC115568489 isoform X1 n=1 Tax=Sparus aurata TaxID=8175 RepID=UPI0011C0D99D|nr:uncharacterized protein LOC115568489 isoform X1 [Sparus aurata]
MKVAEVENVGRKRRGRVRKRGSNIQHEEEVKKRVTQRQAIQTHHSSLSLLSSLLSPNDHQRSWKNSRWPGLLVDLRDQCWRAAGGGADPLSQAQRGTPGSHPHLITSSIRSRPDSTPVPDNSVSSLGASLPCLPPANLPPVSSRLQTRTPFVEPAFSRQTPRTSSVIPAACRLQPWTLSVAHFEPSVNKAFFALSQPAAFGSTSPSPDRNRMGSKSWSPTVLSVLLCALEFTLHSYF